MADSRFETLLELMARLRAPGGCPWDREQTLGSLRRYLVEETYEAIDAIERRDWADLAEELGDIQLQIVFQSQIAKENGWFGIDDVLGHINDKLIRRHPHVFGSESADTAGKVLQRWEEIKAEEKRSEAANQGRSDREKAGLLTNVTRAQPAMLEAQEISKRAARAGFEWREAAELVEKAGAEMQKFREARACQDPDRTENEIGDLLFLLVNVARRAGVDPELALRRANRKFRVRFGSIEQELRDKGLTIEEAGVEEMEQLWQQAKSR